jgi:hypothetical protein
VSQRGYTKEDKEWLEKITQLGCICCINEFNVFTPASPHHIEGRTKEGCHLKTIPLCRQHHQTGGNGIAFHATGKKKWNEKYSSEYELLKQIIKGE